MLQRSTLNAKASGAAGKICSAAHGVGPAIAAKMEMCHSTALESFVSLVGCVFDPATR